MAAVGELLDAAREILRTRFGYPDFRAGQTEAIATILARRDVLVVLPTGGGKSLCYQVPALVLPGMTVVISPLISLMHDQVQALQRRGVAATCLDSTIPRTELQSRTASAMRGEVTLLYVAPERLMTGDLAGQLRRRGVELLAVDEAHCISEWGHDFRPSYLRLAEARRALGSPPTIALTATATPDVRRDIVRQVELRQPRVIVTGFDRPNLSFTVKRADSDNAKRTALLDVLRRSDGPSVVYASTRSAVERLASFLSRSGIPAAAYHAGRDDTVRARAQEAFMKDRVRAIVATNAFGMGVDKADVRVVVHFALPGTLEAYYQEAGRGGRDGKPAAATLLHAYADRFTHEFFISCACPPFDAVTTVHTLLRNAVNGLDVTALALRGGPAVRGAALDSAIRVLRGAGFLAPEEIPDDRVRIRLVARPGRVRSVLGIHESFELGVLRALWRAHGEALTVGVDVTVSQLQPGLSRLADVAPALDYLQSRQLVVWSAQPARIRLLDRKAPLAPAITRDSLDRRRRHSLGKLRAMERYAFATSCRRAELLRYFGEELCRPCAGCDNCSQHGSIQ